MKMMMTSTKTMVTSMTMVITLFCGVIAGFVLAGVLSYFVNNYFMSNPKPFEELLEEAREAIHNVDAGGYTDLPAEAASLIRYASRLVCPLTFGGYCAAAVEETYFREMLLPAVPVEDVIVLDNASFHKSPTLLALAEATGAGLVFLPAYSPDLNPIGHTWATLKKLLQDGLQEAKDKTAFIGKACLSLYI